MEAPHDFSSVFIRNIAYDCDDEELKRTLKIVGPYRDMKQMIGEKNIPKGFGFCTYNNPDIASSAIRNMNKLAINNRELSIGFAADKQASTNLLPEDIRDRDKAEMVNQAGENGDLLDPQTSTVDEMMRNLSDD